MIGDALEEEVALLRGPLQDAAGPRAYTWNWQDRFGDMLYGHQESDFAVADAIGMVAQNRGISRAQVGLAWLLGKTAVSAPIIGTTKLAHLEDAVGAVDVTLTEDEIATLEAPYQPHPVMGHR